MTSSGNSDTGVLGRSGKTGSGVGGHLGHRVVVKLEPARWGVNAPYLIAETVGVVTHDVLRFDAVLRGDELMVAAPLTGADRRTSCVRPGGIRR